MVLPSDTVVHVRTRSGVQPQDGQVSFCQSTASLPEGYMTGPSFPNQEAVVKFPKGKTLAWLYVLSRCTRAQSTVFTDWNSQC